MDKAEITNLQQQSVANITERLPAMARADLIELAAQEAASAAPRSTLQAAIDKQLAALDAAEEGGNGGNNDAIAAATAAEAEKVAAAEAAAKVAEASKPPAKITKDDFRHPEYAGPLNGEQASWRVANIKPVEKVRTK